MAGIPRDQLPAAIGDILFELEKLRANPAVISQALNEFDHITLHILWGNRADGERDINKRPAIKADMVSRLNLARGCVAAIQGLVRGFETQLAFLEEKDAWDAQLNGPANGQATVTIIPPAPKANGVRIDTDNFEI